MSDSNLITEKSQNLYSSLITRNWPSGQTGKTQWNDLILVNPHNAPAAVTIKVYSARNGAGKTNGQLLATLQKTFLLMIGLILIEIKTGFLTR